MRHPSRLPDTLVGRAFHRDEAMAVGVTARMLEHRRFVEEFPRVYRHRDTVLDANALIAAARLALPDDACLSHLTRLVPLGLELDDLVPLRFTLARDHHLRFQRIFVHRTSRMPPHREGSVDVEGAFLMAAAELTPLEIVQVADWLLHRGHLRLDLLRDLLRDQHWRIASGRVEQWLPMVDGRAASLPESHLRCLLVAAGLPVPEVNADVHDHSGRFLARGDLVYRSIRLVVEFEGRQHAVSTQQFQRDIHRYGGLRDGAWHYVQVTTRMLTQPRTTVLEVHRAMVRAGYEGPPPVFGDLWEALTAEPLVRLKGFDGIEPAER